jgi:hypothetical protein
MEWKNNIDSLNISIGADFFQEKILLRIVSNKLEGTKCLAGGQRRDSEVVLTGSSYGVFCDLLVKCRGVATGSTIIIIEK